MVDGVMTELCLLSDILKSYPLVLVNVTLFGNKGFADTITLTCGHTGLRWVVSPNPV